MPALYTQIGPWRLHTFTLALGVVIVLSLVVVARRSQPRGRVVDACLGALVGGVIVARLFHVLLQWDYFVDNLPEAGTIGAGGLDWHGAVIGGLAGLAIVTRYQLSVASQKRGAEDNIDNNAHLSASLRFNVLLDSLTFALPLIGLGAWYGCLAAGCGYGREVDTLANYPAWAASELVDVFGIVAPRFNTPYFGMALCGMGLALVGVSGWWRGWRIGPTRHRERTPRMASLHTGRKFWILLALLSSGMFVIGFFRGDRTFDWYGLRVDQILDLIIALWALTVVSYGRSGFRFLKNRSVIHEQTS